VAGVVVVDLGPQAIQMAGLGVIAHSAPTPQAAARLERSLRAQPLELAGLAGLLLDLLISVFLAVLVQRVSLIQERLRPTATEAMEGMVLWEAPGQDLRQATGLPEQRILVVVAPGVLERRLPLLLLAEGLARTSR